MDEFCGSKFWDWDVIWNTNDPNLTPCFQKTVLVWMPSLFLWIFGIFIYWFRPRFISQTPWSCFNILKVFLCLLLILLQFAKLTIALLVLLPQGFVVYSLDLYTPVLEIATYVLALATILFSKYVGITSSNVQFGFWFLKAVCQVVPLRTAFRNYYSIKDNGELILFLVEVISFPLIVAEFLLNCWADPAIVIKESAGAPKRQIDRSCPRSQSSTLNKLVFSWFDSLAWKGYKKPLETTDLWELDPEYTTSSIVKTFDEKWSSRFKKSRKDFKEGKKAKPVSLLSVLFASFGAQFVLRSLLRLVPDLLAFVQPQILNVLIIFVSGDEEIWKGYFYAILLLVTDVIANLTRNHQAYLMFMTTFHIKTALMGAVYRKALVISNTTRRERTVGEIVNLMSVDVNKIGDLIPFLNLLWSAPMQIGLALYFLWDILGPSSLASIGVMVLLIPINGVVTNKLKKYQISQMKSKDQRVKLMSEILSGIKILKLYAWEPSFQNQVMKIREKEVETLTSAAYAAAFTDFLFTCSQFLAMLVTFATFVFVDKKNVLDARTAFVALALLNLLAKSLMMLPIVIVFGVQATVSIKRLSRFMNSEEIDFGAISHDPQDVDPVVIENGSFTWEGPQTNFLQYINLRVKKGSLVAIVGAVGSGKSSLLSAILGEMEKTSGRVNTIGNISYASQIPWIQNETLRQNVLFGRPFNPARYNKVIEACCLNPDLDVFPGRDNIEIGEKGINLSGGQKQRVSVARAAYNSASIFLFDDPLSAVDAHVGKDMFDNVFGPNGILRSKTRILVTHSVTFLPLVDQIIVLKNGRISETGTYQELVYRQGEFSNFLAQCTKSEITDSDEFSQGVMGFRKRRLTSITSECSDKSIDINKPLVKASQPRKTNIEILPEAQKLIGLEFKETTSVPWRLYYDYFQAAGWTWVIVSMVAYVLYQAFAVSANYWLSVWSETGTVNGTQRNQGYNIGVYAALGLGQSVMFYIATTILCLAMLRSSASLHSKMLYSVLRAPMSFFDTTPTGRILNRFSKDVDVLDTTISFMLRNWFSILTSVLGTVAIIVYNLPILAAVILPLSVLYYLVQKFYIPTSRQVKRLESVTRSPIYSNFSEAINGASTIRAYGQRNRFILDCQAKIDSNLECVFPGIVSNRWLAIRLESLGSIFVFSTALFSVMSKDVLSAGSVGLSISYALNVTYLLSLLVRNFCDVETNIVAVERIKEYCEAPQEAPWKSAVRKPAAVWPAYGSIQFDSYQTRYREGLDLVLKSVTFEIQAGEKVGVVGRTGAGKTSLTLALFRLIEGTAGSIVIDGESISKLGLHDLRTKLTIIPQDPVLFSGTLRFNLDPFEVYTNQAIWKVLELAHLRKFVTSLPTQLDHSIAEGGENISVGQKQLVCLARALLRKTKILVLDEATAAVDLETDILIQQTIRSEFKECTVVTIAHRINTIMDSTKILVLDNGFVREYDSPSKLLQDPNSLFYQMAKDAGLVST